MLSTILTTMHKKCVMSVQARPSMNKILSTLICTSLYLQAVEVEFEAKSIVNLISNANNSNRFIASIIVYCFKEAKKCENAFAS